MVRPDLVMQPYAAADIFTSMLHAIDSRDWPGVRRAFADQVDVDYSSLFGAPPARMAADDMVAGWQAFLGGFAATQHLTGPILVTVQEETVTARTHVRGYHYRSRGAGGEVWLVAGHYEVRLMPLEKTWKITAITLRVFYQEGSATITEPARN